MQQLEDYVNQTLGCFEETHTSVCNYEEAIPDWLRDWVKENEWVRARSLARTLARTLARSHARTHARTHALPEHVRMLCPECNVNGAASTTLP